MQTSGYDVETVRKDFPILSRPMADGRPLVYLDSANTSQKPTAVVDAMSEHLLQHNANVARAVHQLGAEATQAYEGARADVARFIGAARPEEVVFTKNASEALNLVARVLGEPGDFGVGPGDEVVVTEMEHHSNLVPWQLLCERVGARLRWFGVTDEGRLDPDFDAVLSERTKVVSLTWVSNALGTVNPVREVAARAKEVGALVVVDGSQAVPQLPVDVSSLGADLVAFTG
ncbi:MAG: aminotransferase class V-fold PLP-dependent enzyme, partial [Actinomycetes bacterium]